MSNKILHLGSCEKFLPRYVEFLKENFEIQQHIFLLTRDGGKDKELQQFPNVDVAGRGMFRLLIHYLKRFYYICSCRKVIIHNLFDEYLIVLLFFMPWALSKSNWVIWGADLYSYQKPKHSFRSKLIESMKQHVIERIGGLVTYLSGDVALARKWYKAKGKYIECLMYPSNLFNVEELKINVQLHKSILVGNSADPSNNHIEIFKKLENFKHENIIVYVPLAYGSKEYASHVISEGEKIFGDRFVPLTNFMAFEDYMKFLQGIDIAIFAHKRQQGMGNTISLLGMGKKVVIRRQVSQWSFFKELGITVFDFEGLDLELMKVDNSEQNKKLVKMYFSQERLCHQLNILFK